MTANPMSTIPPIGPTTGMVSSPASSKFKQIDPIRILRQHIVLLVFTSLVGLIIGGGTWAALRITIPEWSSEAQLRYIRGPDDPWKGFNEQMENQDTTEAIIQAEVMRIRSEEILRDALGKQMVRDTNWFKGYDNNLEKAREDLQKKYLAVWMVRGAPVISMRARTRDADDAQRILRAIIDSYMKKLKIDTSNKSRDIRNVFVREQEMADQAMRHLQEQMNEFTLQQEISTLEANQSETALELQNLTELKVQLLSAIDQYNSRYDTLMKIKDSGHAEPTPDVIAELEMTPLIQQLSQSLQSLRQQREVYIQEYGPNHMQVRKVGRYIAAAEAEKKREIERLAREQQEAEIQSLAKTIEMLKGQYAELEPKLLNAAQRMTDLTTKITRFEHMEKEYETAEEEKTIATQSLMAQRVNEARPDTIPFQEQMSPSTPEVTFPPKWYITIPGVALLVIGTVTGLIFLRELMDQRIRTSEDVKMIAQTELLGMIPDTMEDPSGPVAVERVVENQPTGIIAESYRQVRAAILTKMDRRGYKTLMIVGAQPKCGTTSVAHNLGASMAFNGRRTLIIDANFRRPKLHEIMGDSNTHGLIEVLKEQCTYEQAIKPTGDLSLFLLPAGNSFEAPPELLDQPAFKTVLSQLETQYDLIIIDAPPALLASDSRLLAKHVDALAIVVQAGTDKRGMIERMLREIDGQRADILGVVLNAVKSSAGGYFRKSYRDFYRYAQDNNNSNGKTTRKQKAITETQSTT